MISRHQSCCYVVLAFAIPFAARLIPELLMGPYVTGFDPMGFYVPIVINWAHHGVDLMQIVASAPLLYSLLLFVTKLGAPLVLSLKTLGPFLHGFLSLSIYFYSQRAMQWSYKRSVAVSLLATLYFIGLRTSWDMFRVQLGLIFIFVALSFFSRRDLKGKIIMATSIFLVVLSDQYTAAVMLWIILLGVLRNVTNKKYESAVDLAILSLPAMGFFVASIYANSLASSTFISEQIGMPNLPDLWWLNLQGMPLYPRLLIEMSLFFVFSYIFLFPLVVSGKSNLRNSELKWWSILCLVAAFFPVLFSSVRYRWILLLIYPLSFYAVEGVARIRKSSSRKHLKTMAIVLSILSFSFVFLPLESSFPYFLLFTNYVPDTMLFNTVPLSDCRDVQNSLLWLNRNSDANSCLIAHTAFYGWALLYLNDDLSIETYGFDSPDNAARVQSQQGFTHVYLVWWINGSGLHGQPTVSRSFEEIYASNRIAVYEYAD